MFVRLRKDHRKFPGRRAGPREMWLTNRRARYVRCVEQPIDRFRVGPRARLRGDTPTTVARRLGRKCHQPLGSSLVPQLRRPKLHRRPRLPLRQQGRVLPGQQKCVVHDIALPQKPASPRPRHPCPDIQEPAHPLPYRQKDVGNSKTGLPRAKHDAAPRLCTVDFRAGPGRTIGLGRPFLPTNATCTPPLRCYSFFF